MKRLNRSQQKWNDLIPSQVANLSSRIMIQHTLEDAKADINALHSKLSSLVSEALILTNGYKVIELQNLAAKIKREI